VSNLISWIVDFIEIFDGNPRHAFPTLLIDRHDAVKSWGFGTPNGQPFLIGYEFFIYIKSDITILRARGKGKASGLICGNNICGATSLQFKSKIKKSAS